MALAACSGPKEWTPQQREQMREQLRAYREWAYLQNLNDSEYMLFSDNVAGTLEIAYPNYTVFVAMPGMNDTVSSVVITQIVQDITTDARNMRHLFPYDYLKSRGILPDGMNRDQLKAYYQCLANKINNGYVSMEGFLWAAMQNNIDSTVVGQLQRQCAQELSLDMVKNKQKKEGEKMDRKQNEVKKEVKKEERKENKK